MTGASAPHDPPEAAWRGSDLFVCPSCGWGLVLSDDGTAVTCAEGHRFEVVDGRAVLIDGRSAFAADDVAARRNSYFDARASESSRKATWRRRLPSLGVNRRGAAFADDAARLLEGLDRAAGTPRGLVLGCGERGADRVARFPGIDWTLTDVDLHYGAEASVDVMALPLPDASVDVVLVEHVLEHVVDPIRAAAEIERVLRVGGLVLAVMPFSFPWHGAPIDFFRITPSGMRVLFRGCSVEHLSAGMGGGSALSYGAVTSVTGMVRPGRRRRIAYVLGRVLLSPLRALDRFEDPAGRAIGFAAEYQFIGRRSSAELTNHELLDEVRARFG